jgi:integrase
MLSTPTSSPAAFGGLRRGELVALRWRDVVFEREAIRVRASYSYGALTTPKSGRARTVPMVAAVAERLIALREREQIPSPSWLPQDLDRGCSQSASS